MFPAPIRVLVNLAHVGIWMVLTVRRLFEQPRRGRVAISPLALRTFSA
jgi:hypothetical protein